MPAVLSTLRLGVLRTKKEENPKKEVRTSYHRHDVESQLEKVAKITSRMKENHNPRRPLPNALNLPKKNLLVLNDDIKVLLPPSQITTQKSDEAIAKVFEEVNSSPPKEPKPVTELQSSSSSLSVNAPEFTPGSKLHCGKSSRGSSPFDSLSTGFSETSSATISPSPPLIHPSLNTMTLPCISLDGMLRQYVWRIDKDGDLMPDLNTSVLPPRIIAHSSHHGPSIVIPVSSNFKIASGCLIVDQLRQLRLPCEALSQREDHEKKRMVDESFTHPSDFVTCNVERGSCDASCQTENDKDENVKASSPEPESFVMKDQQIILLPPPTKKITRYSREVLIELMNEEFSIVAPKLQESVHKLLSNSGSSNFLADTISRDDSSSSLSEKLIQKSSSISTFECSVPETASRGSLLKKSVSWENSKRENAAGDGWNQVGTGEQALKMFRSALNKLTADNFEVVLAEVKRMRVNDNSTILSFIELLYEKAILEPTYATHYVQLTMALKNIFTIGPGKKSFEHFAIVACQRGFEEAMHKLNHLNQMDDDAKDKLRRGLSGSIQFIAKMYLNGILTRRIVMEICDNLLKLKCPESVEPLCKLLEIAGETVEKDAPKDEKLIAIMKTLSSIASKFPTRIKFMIENLIEQRQNGWKPRFNKDGPKKLDQVANECGFVKRVGAVGRYDEMEVMPAMPETQQQRTMQRNENLNRGDYFGARANQGHRSGNRGCQSRNQERPSGNRVSDSGSQENHGRTFRGSYRRGGKPFVNR